LLLESHRDLPLALRRRGLSQAEDGTHGPSQGDSALYGPIHSHPYINITDPAPKKCNSPSHAIRFFSSKRRGMRGAQHLKISVPDQSWL
jgi:hypothetical protein